MASVRQAPRCVSKKGAPVGLHQVGDHYLYTRPSADKSLVELAELLRELHQSLQDYGPIWFTQELNTRIRKKLAAAERARAAFQE